MIAIPTISQLYSNILSHLEAEMEFTIPLFGKVFLRALAGVQAAKLKIFYLAVASLQKNIFVDTADPEASGGTLERFGRIKLGRNPFAATAGQYVLTITGTVGAIIPAGTTFKSNDDSLNPGKLFVLDTAYTLDGTDTITVRALEAGLDSQLNVGDKLTATAPIANVNSLANVSSEAVEPLAEEETEDYRANVLEAFQLEPQGGAATDYRLWASDAQGVKQTYPYATVGFNNEVTVFVEATEADSTDGKGTPSAQILSDVEDVIELDPDTTRPISERGRRPLGVFQVNVNAITPLNVDIDITGYVGLTAAKQTTIFNALKAAISEIRPFIASADLLSNQNDTISINKAIFIVQDAVPGSVFTSLTLKVNNVSVSSYQFLNGDIPFLNTVDYL